jgi:hypothetical protein
MENQWESAAGSGGDDSPLTCGVGKDFFCGIFTQAINAFSTTQRAYSNVILPHWISRRVQRQLVLSDASDGEFRRCDLVRAARKKSEANPYSDELPLAPH